MSDDLDAALLSLDKTRIDAFLRRCGEPPLDDHVWLAAAHKARTGIPALPESARRESIQWLRERGLTHYAADLDS